MAVLWLIAAALPLRAVGFDAFLARFKEIQPPAALEPPEDPGSIPIEEFEAFILVPGRALAARRPALRSLEEWPDHVRQARAYQARPVYDEGYEVGISPLGRWTAGGYILAAVEVSAHHSYVDGGQSWSSRYLLSYSPSGKLIDGLRYAKSKDYPPPLASGGAPSLEGASLSLDPEGRILAFDDYGIYKDNFEFIAGEAWSWNISQSPDGTLKESPEKRSFLLSKIYAESGEGPRRLYVYETEAPSRGAPAYLAWHNSQTTEIIWAQVRSGLAATGRVVASDASGRSLALDFSQDGKSASLADPAGKTYALIIEYGPGASGEPTRMSGITPPGDRYDPQSASWTYLFAEASLPLVPDGEQLLFAARSFVVGTTAAGYKGSPDALIRRGTPAKARESGLGTGMALFEPRSLCDFKNGLVEAGTLARDLDLGGEARVILPAGTRLEIDNWNSVDPPDHWRALLSKETSIQIIDQKVRAPAGSRLLIASGISVVEAEFPTALRLRLGSSEASIIGFDFLRRDELSLAAPFATTIAGKKVTLVDAIGLGAGGIVETGRLGGDLELSAGGRTFTIRGGYDPERPEAGIVGFYPNGKLLSGTLAKGARVQTGKAELDLAEGDAVVFGEDGSLQSATPAGLSIVTVDGRKGEVKVLSINRLPDGGFSILAADGRLVTAKDKLVLTGLGAVCTDTRVRVRTAPDLQASILGHLDKGDRLLVLDRNTRSKEESEGNGDFWYRIRRVSDGLTGWSYGLYLKLDP